MVAEPILVVLGPPGAGKGTQAHLLSEALGLMRLSIGTLLREIVAQGLAVSGEIRHAIERGDLVAEQVATDALVERLTQADMARSGLIIDGYPRRLSQAAILDTVLRPASVSAVLFLDVPSRVTADRMLQRRVCSLCEQSAVAGASGSGCTTCGGSLRRRKDDKPEVIERRLAVYEAQTAPLVDHYRGVGLLEVIDAEGTVAEVFDCVLAALRRRIGHVSTLVDRRK